ncbi:hypothetical protein [Afipia carboxidovorans]|uniref:hypothetical protein n=1 Tax=Afipia carboxidovorans TaxID=40137 RepID=UPI003091E090|nr:hypothetical protein CRBSH125_09570 [Afipia carboxidovorans]
MTDDDRKRAAQTVLEVPFFIQLWDELEQAAINGCIYAKNTDHETRQAYAAEVRAIRSVRQRLESAASGQSSAGRKAPA